MVGSVLQGPGWLLELQPSCPRSRVVEPDMASAAALPPHPGCSRSLGERPVHLEERRHGRGLAEMLHLALVGTSWPVGHNTEV